MCSHFRLSWSNFNEYSLRQVFILSSIRIYVHVDVKLTMLISWLNLSSLFWSCFSSAVIFSSCCVWRISTASCWDAPTEETAVIHDKQHTLRKVERFYMCEQIVGDSEVLGDRSSMRCCFTLHIFEYYNLRVMNYWLPNLACLTSPLLIWFSHNKFIRAAYTIG